MTYSLSRLLFLGLLVVGFVLFVFQTPRDWPYFIAAVCITALACVALAYGKWFEPNRIAAVLPPLAVVLAIALLREGQGGSLSGFAALYLLPVLWVAFFGTRATLGVVLVAVLTAFWLPIVLEGAPHYPSSQWRSGGLLVVIVGMSGLAIQQLLIELAQEEERRALAELQLRKISAYELHDDVVQNLTAAQLAMALGDGDRARSAVAKALEVGQQIVENLLATEAPRAGRYVMGRAEGEGTGEPSP
jgi:signal transduction histidine kinase